MQLAVLSRIPAFSVDWLLQFLSVGHSNCSLSSVFFRFEQPLAMFSLASLQLLAVCIDLFILFPDLLALFECLVIL